MIAQEVSDGGFKPAETEVVSGIVDEGAGKRVGGRIPGGGQPVHLRTTRVGESHQFRGFIEAFARRVVQGAAKKGMLKLRLDMHQHGVPAADDQTDGRDERVEVRF